FTGYFFFFQAEDGIRDFHVTGVQTCALPICADAIRDADEDDALLRELRAVIGGRSRRARGEAAAVDPHHDRQALVRAPRRRPDVEIEAVLADHGRRTEEGRQAFGLHAARVERIRA